MKLKIWKTKSYRRLSAVIMAGVMAVSLLPASALTARAEEPDAGMALVVASAEVQSNPFSFESDSDAEKLTEEAKSFPASFDLRHCDTDGDGVYENYVTPVKLQNPFGTCWGFGAIAAAEISLLGSGLAQADGYGPVADPQNGIRELNLSEKHLTHFTSTALNDRNASQNGEGLHYPDGTVTSERLNTGGQMFYATQLFASGIGPNLEDRSGLDPGDEDILTYQGKHGFVEFQRSDMDNNGTFRLTPVWYSEEDDWSIPEKYRFYASYRLKESYELPSPAGKDEEGQYVYNEDGTNAIKGQLLAKRGVTIAFHADSSIPGQDPASKGYMSENWDHYTWDTQLPNHAVCIVGWDDSYPKENFTKEHQPPADGAWLVKNSWGAATNSDFANNGYRHWGIRDENGTATGYFWLSYYDVSLYSPEAFAFDKSNVGHKFYVEQYDFLPISSISEITTEAETGMANVFRAEADSVLSQLSFQTATPGTEVTYEVYLLEDGFDSPTKGEPVISGSETYPIGGYHKVNLPEGQQVEMKEGQLFSVAVKEQTPSGSWSYILPQGISGDFLTEMGVKSLPQCVVNDNESFFYTDTGWHDLSDEDFVQALSSNGDTSDNGILGMLMGLGDLLKMSYDNFPIKAYLEPIGEVKDNGIDPDPTLYQEPEYDGKLTMDIGGDVLLYPGSTTRVGARFFGAENSVANPNQAVTWTSSDPSVFTIEPYYDGNDGKKILTGVNPGTATLTADAGANGKQTVTVTVEERTFESVLLSSSETAYTGEPIQPKPMMVVVSKLPDEDIPTPVEGKDYRVEYKNNVKCGTAQAILVGMGDYEGLEVPVDFKIVPARVEITGTTLRDGTLTVQFSSQAESGISGYTLSWRPAGADDEDVQTLDLPPEATSAEITGLEPDEIYTVVLSAYVSLPPGPDLTGEEDSDELVPKYGQSSLPAIISTCGADETCPIRAFSDLSSDAWYHDGVHWALEQDVMNGVENDRFDPNGETTRAMVVTMIWRLAGEPESSKTASFTDVKDGAWYAPAVNWAAEAGIVNGYSDTVFAPNDDVTREQLAAILYRCYYGGLDPAALEGFVNAILSMLGDVSTDDFNEEKTPLPFEDADSVSEWASDAVYWAWDEGIINGRTNTLLKPRDSATRAEVATMFLRLSSIIEPD